MEKNKSKLQSTLKMTPNGLKSSHQWSFKVYFRTGIYGWRGSQLAAKRLKEALREINKVNKQESLLAAEGAIFLMSRLWPALEHIDTSSGSLGNAVGNIIEKLLPILINAPASLLVRQYWLDILWEILQADGVGYVADIAQYWGELAGYPEESSRRADVFASLVKVAWQRDESIVHYDVAYLSALYFAERFDEVLDAIKKDPRPSWQTREFGARVLVLTDPDKAIAYAENTRDIINTNQVSISCFCEEALIKTCQINEAYIRYAIPANNANTYLNWFNKIKKKYKTIKTDQEILSDLIAANIVEPGKWFATANKLKCFDLALELIKANPADPKTLNRAAKNRLDKEPNYSLNVAMSSLYWMTQGFGYEISNCDVHDALSIIKQSAKELGLWRITKQQLEKMVETDTMAFISKTISASLG
jgi:hypothetical protein